MKDDDKLRGESFPDNIARLNMELFGFHDPDAIPIGVGVGKQLRDMYEAAKPKISKSGFGTVMIFGTGGDSNHKWFEEQLNKTVPVGDIFMNVDAIPKRSDDQMRGNGLYSLFFPMTSTEKESFSQDDKFWKFERYDRNK